MVKRPHKESGDVSGSTSTDEAKTAKLKAKEAKKQAKAAKRAEKVAQKKAKKAERAKEIRERLHKKRAASKASKIEELAKKKGLLVTPGGVGKTKKNGKGKGSENGKVKLSQRERKVLKKKLKKAESLRKGELPEKDLTATEKPKLSREAKKAMDAGKLG
eukprot:TRINITY_DN3647_c0_g2_i2.p1 TRINITY_DN3647_c0_g2~~TRINITY_DN3647_c0_g2_i2.p1  ORF type:complete len:160 (-),score=51.88 TRINITY_DN3647_c0_g2_i2:34-513(-)